MRKPLLIYSTGNFHHAVGAELANLKDPLQQACGKKIRRIDRFTQLALIGSYQCKADLILPEKTGVYMASKAGSLNNTASVLSQIYQQGQLPKPINFINTVSSSACFYLAEQLGLSACNQFFASEDFTIAAGLKLASLDLDASRVDAALIGVVCEAGNNIAVHRKRLQLDASKQLAEGSHWLCVGYDLEAKNPLAKIIAIEQPVDEHDLDDVISELLIGAQKPAAIVFSNTISMQQQKHILQHDTVYAGSFAPHNMLHEYPAAFEIQGFLDKATKHERFIYVDKNAQNFYSLMAIEMLSFLGR